MEPHNDPSHYNIHSQEDRNHLLHNKGHAYPPTPPTETPSRDFNENPIGIHIAQSMGAIGDIPLPSMESEESKKNVFASHAESFTVAEHCIAHTTAFEEMIHAVGSEDYLAARLKEKSVLQEYVTHFECEKKYKTTAAYGKAKERCAKERKTYAKDSNAFPRIFMGAKCGIKGRAHK